MTTLKVALIQQSCGADRCANLETSIAMVRRAAAQGAGLVVLQELHGGLYFCQQEDPALCDWAEPIEGETVSRLKTLCSDLGIVLVASIFERRAPGLYHNTAVVLERDGTIAGVYRKMHIPDDPGFYEKFYFTPGDLGFTPIDTSVGRLGVLVCWDQWYPEAARLMALAGAELLVYPTAIGWDPADSEVEQQRQRDAWLTVQRGHAVANGLPVLAVNRVGFEAPLTGTGAGIKFWGSSFAAGPQGEILAVATEQEEQILLVEIDRGKSETVRRMWPFFRDRRIDAYGDLMTRYRD